MKSSSKKKKPAAGDYYQHEIALSGRAWFQSSNIQICHFTRAPTWTLNRRTYSVHQKKRAPHLQKPAKTDQNWFCHNCKVINDENSAENWKQHERERSSARRVQASVPSGATVLTPKSVGAAVQTTDGWRRKNSAALATTDTACALFFFRVVHGPLNSHCCGTHLPTIVSLGVWLVDYVAPSPPFPFPIQFPERLTKLTPETLHLLLLTRSSL